VSDLGDRIFILARQGYTARTIAVTLGLTIEEVQATLFDPSTAPPENLPEMISLNVGFNSIPADGSDVRLDWSGWSNPLAAWWVLGADPDAGALPGDDPGWFHLLKPGLYHIKYRVIIRNTAVDGVNQFGYLAVLNPRVYGGEDFSGTTNENVGPIIGRATNWDADAVAPHTLLESELLLRLAPAEVPASLYVQAKNLAGQTAKNAEGEVLITRVSAA
jgi:hypothetical protein